ncbi:MAG: tetratricopeptide repeat protein [Nitrospirae bacterium]|nr:tetratricopeptide repeat protein [Nitrospirota bacterium]
MNEQVKHFFHTRFITFFTFMLNYQLHGLDVTGYHVVNLAIHIINALLVYWLVVLTFKTPFFNFHPSSLIPHLLIALFSALLFVSHPIQTQAVTYITQRFTSLATLFYLLSLVMYVKFRTQNTEHKVQNTDKRQKIFSLSSVFWYLTSVLSAVLAMKTKEIAFTLPIIIVLYEIFFFSKSQNSETSSSMQNPPIPPLTKGGKGGFSCITRHAGLSDRQASRFLYFLFFLLTMLIIPLSLIGVNDRIDKLTEDLNEITKSGTSMSRWDYLFTQFRVIVTYVRLLFFPVNQNLDYDYPIYNSFLNPNVFLSFLFLLSIFGLGVYLFYYSKNPPSSPFYKGGIKGDQASPNSLTITHHALRIMAFGIFFFFITLSVESSIIPIEDIIFEHRLYLPSIGLIIAFVSAVFCFSPYLSSFNLQPSSFLSRHALRITVLLLTTSVIVLAIATYQRNSVWQDVFRLCEDMVKKSPKKARTHNNVGLAYYLKGETDKAIEHFQIALSLNPYYVPAHNNLYIAYTAKGWIKEGLQHFYIAQSLKPHR